VCSGGTVESPVGCSSTNSHFGFGTPTVMSDGTVVVPVVTGLETVIQEGGITTGYQLIPELSVLKLRQDRTTVVSTIPLSLSGVLRVRPFKAIPNGEGGLIIGWEHEEYSAGFPRVWAHVTGLNASGEVTGGAGVGEGWGDLVLGEQDTVWSLNLVDGQRRLVQPLTLEGNPSGSSWLLDAPNGFGSLTATAGGGALVNFTDGGLLGPDDAYALMNLGSARYIGGETWVRSTAQGIVGMAGPHFTNG
jgi:hypothetical protein